jgi:hypothetical protein
MPADDEGPRVALADLQAAIGFAGAILETQAARPVQPENELRPDPARIARELTLLTHRVEALERGSVAKRATGNPQQS